MLGLFSRKFIDATHPQIFFDIISVYEADYVKHKGLILDSKLFSNMHIKVIIAKVNKTRGPFRRCHETSFRLQRYNFN